MRFVCHLMLSLLLVGVAATAFAEENGTTSTNTSVVRTTATVSTGTVVSRIATVMAPSPTPAAPRAPAPAPAAPGSGAPGGGAPGGGAPAPAPGGDGATSMLSQPGFASADGTQLFSVEGQTGLAAGEEGNKLAVWGMGLYNNLEDHASASKFDGSLYSLMVGMDYKVLDNLLAGVAAGYETLDLNTSFNNGSMDNQGFTIMPYMSYGITDTVLVDVAAGASWLDYDVTERQAGVNRSASYNAFRTTVSGGISKYFLVDSWALSVRAGTLYSNEAKDSYTIGTTSNSKTDVYLGQASLGTKAAYSLGKFEPYVGAAYLYDYSIPNGVGVDRDEIEGTFGFVYHVTDNFRVSAEGANSFDRDNLTNNRVLFNARYEF